MSVEDTDTIDFIASDPRGEIMLVMVEHREWDGSDERLCQLEEKINNYASFALEGQLLEQHPELVGKPVRLELRYASPPDPATSRFLDLAREKLGARGLGFITKPIRSNPLG